MDHTNRPLDIASFLDQHGWGEASAQAVDGGFSPRRYARLTKVDGSTAILMDADADQKTPEFVALDKILRNISLHAPEIIAAEPAQGLVLMQDFGSDNIGVLLDSGSDGRAYFLQAAALLAQLHQRFDRTSVVGRDMPLFTADLFTSQAEMFLDAYVPFALEREATPEERQDFRAAWRAVLRPLEVMPKSLLLRDFMPDNLMALPDGAVGVLDFQDAGIGPVAYDLASLCEEVRRDGGFALLPEVIAAYREQYPTAPSYADLIRACTILSAQRHTRILGIIAQHARKTGRRDKLDFMPRIVRHLQQVMSQTYLQPVQELITRFGSMNP